MRTPHIRIGGPSSVQFGMSADSFLSSNGLQSLRSLLALAIAIQQLIPRGGGKVCSVPESRNHFVAPFIGDIRAVIRSSCVPPPHCFTVSRLSPTRVDNNYIVDCAGSLQKTLALYRPNRYTWSKIWQGRETDFLH